MWVVVIPPGQATGKHYHPGYEFIYTMDGTGIMQEEGKSDVAIKPGAAFYLRSSSDRADYVHEQEYRDHSDQTPGSPDQRSRATHGKAGEVARNGA